MYIRPLPIPRELLAFESRFKDTGQLAPFSYSNKLFLQKKTMAQAIGDKIMRMLHLGKVSGYAMRKKLYTQITGDNPDKLPTASTHVQLMQGASGLKAKIVGRDIVFMYAASAAALNELSSGAAPLPLTDAEDDEPQTPGTQAQPIHPSRRHTDEDVRRSALDIEMAGMRHPFYTEGPVAITGGVQAAFRRHANNRAAAVEIMVKDKPSGTALVSAELGRALNKMPPAALEMVMRFGKG